MAETSTTTRLYIAGRDTAFIVSGSPDAVQTALVAGGGAMVPLDDDYGDVVIVNPAHVTHLAPGPEAGQMPVIDIG